MKQNAGLDGDATGSAAVWSLEDGRGLCVLRLCGSAGHVDADNLRQAAGAILNTAARVVVVDLAGLAEVGCEALGVLLHMQALLGTRGRRLYLLVGSRGVRSTLARTRLGVLLPQVQNVREASQIAGRA